TQGRVVRHLEEGFAIEFLRLQHPDFLEENVTGGEKKPHASDDLLRANLQFHTSPPHHLPVGNIIPPASCESVCVPLFPREEAQSAPAPAEAIRKGRYIMKTLVMAVMAALAILLTQALPEHATAAPKGKFVRAWAECDAIATERGFGRNNTGRF